MSYFYFPLNSELWNLCLGATATNCNYWACSHGTKSCKQWRIAITVIRITDGTHKGKTLHRQRFNSYSDPNSCNCQSKHRGQAVTKCAQFIWGSGIYKVMWALWGGGGTSHTLVIHVYVPQWRTAPPPLFLYSRRPLVAFFMVLKLPNLQRSSRVM